MSFVFFFKIKQFIYSSRIPKSINENRLECGIKYKIHIGCTLLHVRLVRVTARSFLTSARPSGLRLACHCMSLHATACHCMLLHALCHCGRQLEYSALYSAHVSVTFLRLGLKFLYQPKKKDSGWYNFFLIQKCL